MTKTTDTGSLSLLAQVKRDLRRQLPVHLAEVLLPTLQWRSSNRRLTAVVPNQIWEEIFDEHCRHVVGQRIDNRGIELRLICRQEEVEHHWARQASFDNFLQYPGNQFALSACRQVQEAPGIEHNPLYLHGPSGCGKTHLLQALAQAFTTMVGDDMVMQLDGGEWVAHQAQELAEHGPTPLRTRLEEAVLITFDNIDILANRSLAQEQLFHLINNAMEAGQQMVLAGSAPPRYLAGMEERVTTRLGWGLAVSIDPPPIEARLALLRQLAPSVIEDMDSNEITRLVENLAPDMKHVSNLAERLLDGEQILSAASAASFDRVLECVARRYGLRPGDIAGKRRHRTVAQARQLALLLGRRLTSHSLEALGGMVGGRDHSTVLYNIRQAEERLQADGEFAREVAKITQQILESANPDHSARPSGG